MTPKTVDRKFDIGKVAPIQCIHNDPLTELDIQNQCFLMLFIRQGDASFQIGNYRFQANSPCLVCFDERQNPKVINKNNLVCDAIYFHPTFLNVNMTFRQIHDHSYEQIASTHDLFLLKPFTDLNRFAYPIFEQYNQPFARLFTLLENELDFQTDWYWSCRSRSYFLEMMLLLERTYGIIGSHTTDIGLPIDTDPILKNAIAYIESHYSQHITLHGLAQALATNHSTLNNLFKTQLQITPIEYVWRHRLAIAKKHLAFTNLSIKEIALRCGFKTTQHFSNKFVSFTGYSPTAFRAMTVNKRKNAFQKDGGTL